MNKLYYDTDSTVKWEIHPFNGNPLGFIKIIEEFSDIDLNMNNLVLILTYV